MEEVSAREIKLYLPEYKVRSEGDREKELRKRGLKCSRKPRRTQYFRKKEMLCVSMRDSVRKN